LHNHSSRIRLSLVNDHFVKEDPGGDAVLATVCACKRRVMASGEALFFLKRSCIFVIIHWQILSTKQYEVKFTKIKWYFCQIFGITKR